MYDYCYDFGWNFGCVLIFSFLVDAKSGSTNDYRIGSSDTSDSNPFSPGSNDIKNSKHFKVFPVSRKTGLKILTFSLISIEKAIEYLSLSENLIFPERKLFRACRQKKFCIIQKNFVKKMFDFFCFLVVIRRFRTNFFSTSGRNFQQLELNIHQSPNFVLFFFKF